MLSSALSRRALSSHTCPMNSARIGRGRSPRSSQSYSMALLSGEPLGTDLLWIGALSGISLSRLYSFEAGVAGRRGGRRGDVAVALRFGHWRAGRRDLLVRMWLDDRGRSAEYRRLRIESSSPDPAITIERVLEHIDDGELSLALRLLRRSPRLLLHGRRSQPSKPNDTPARPRDGQNRPADSTAARRAAGPEPTTPRG